MGFNFPSSPAVGALYPDPAQAGLPQYKWDGTMWLAISPPGPVYAPLDALSYSGLQINGSMEVSQERGDSNFTGTNGYVVDGWQVARAGTMATNSRQFDSGTLPGVPKCLGILTLTAQASIGANDYVQLYQAIEGYRTSRLAWGSVNAKPLTISFWSAHIRPGLYSVAVGTATRSYVATYTQNVSSVFEFKTITIPGCTTGTWETTTAAGFNISFMMACGSTYIAPSANAWHNGFYLAAPGQINGIAATTDNFVITGVTIIPGLYAPTAAQAPLILRPYDQELITCQRYYNWASINLFDNVSNAFSIGAPVFYPTKRVVPTISAPESDPNASGQSIANTAGVGECTRISHSGCLYEVTATAAGYIYVIGFRAAVNARL